MTYEDYLIEQGEPDAAKQKHPCDGCGKLDMPFVLSDARTDDSLPFDWVCGSCLVDIVRQTEAPSEDVLTWDSLRPFRNDLLIATDFVDIPAVRARIGDTKAAELDAYRETLRALPTTYPDPTSVVWPEKP